MNISDSSQNISYSFPQNKMQSFKKWGLIVQNIYSDFSFNLKILLQSFL